MEDQNRATGRTTRIVDLIIQKLFESGGTQIYDHYSDGTKSTSDAMFLMVANIVTNRMKLEHPNIKFRINDNNQSIYLVKEPDKPKPILFEPKYKIGTEVFLMVKGIPTQSKIKEIRLICRPINNDLEKRNYFTYFYVIPTNDMSKDDEIVSEDYIDTQKKIFFNKEELLETIKIKEL